MPGASRTQIAGWLGEALKIRVAAKPEKGKANEAVVTLLAETLGVPRASVTLLSGAASPQKIIEISGLSEAELHARLSNIDG